MNVCISMIKPLIIYYIIDIFWSRV